MKTICKDGISVYLLEDDATVEFVSNGLLIDTGESKFIVSDLTLENMDIHEDITAPDLWRGGVYAFDGEAWVLQLNRAPRVVSMRQARLALLAEGLLDGVNAAITDPAQVIEWEYATEVKRDDDLVSAIAGGLSMTDDQVAGLFLKASMY